MQNILEYWNKFSKREKALVLTASLLVGLLFLLFALKPIYDFPKTQTSKLERVELDLQLIQKARQSLPSQTQNETRTRTKISQDKFQSILTQTAAKQGLSIIRRQPKGKGEVVLWFENVDTKQLYKWVYDLTEQYNIGIGNSYISYNESEGVSVMLSFYLER